MADFVCWEYEFTKHLTLLLKGLVDEMIGEEIGLFIANLDLYVFYFLLSLIYRSYTMRFSFHLLIFGVAIDEQMGWGQGVGLVFKYS